MARSSWKLSDPWCIGVASLVYAGFSEVPGARQSHLPYVKSRAPLPNMHDGSLATLEDVVEFYDKLS